MKTNYHDKVQNEKKKNEQLDIEIERMEENIQKMANEATDLNEEINFNSQKETMFKNQLTEIKQYNAEAKAKW